MGAELFHVDRQADIQTDMIDGADSRYSKFCEKRLKTC